MAVRDLLEISRRAGHRTLHTTEGHIRDAESLREGFGWVFPALPAGLIDRSVSICYVVNTRNYSAKGGT